MAGSGPGGRPPEVELSGETALPPKDRSYPFLRPARSAGELGWFGDFRVLRLLGSGGMGVVFEAEDTALRRRVALKLLRPELAADPEHRERFLREARAAAGVVSDNVVTIYHVGESAIVPFLVMQFLDGESLQDRLGRQPRLDVPTALTIARQAAAGLAAAHDKGLIHRDIKPANLWLESDGPGGPFKRVRLLDFGLARLAHGETSLTSTGFIVGTPNYMAPEQAAGFDIDTRADLFSLGSVTFTMLAGELPFPGDSAMAVMSALASKTPPWLGDLNPAAPPGAANLVARLLAKDPKDRPQSAREVMAALDAILAGLPVPAPTPTPGPVLAPPPAPETLGPTAALTVPGAPPTASEPRTVAVRPWWLLAAAVVIAAAAFALGWSLARL